MYPRVSVITVVFNGINSIEDTILSVLSQKYDNVEYIIIDGKSTDGTVDIVEKYKGNIDVIVSEKDLGIYDAMNKGAKIATGEWIIFMNCGDRFCEENIIYKVFMDDNTNVDVIYGDYIGDINASKGYVIKAKNLEYLKTTGMPFCHQSVFVKSVVLKKNPFDLSYKYLGDFDLFNKLYRNGAVFKYVQYPIANYCLYDGATSVNTLKCFRERMRILKIGKSFLYYKMFVMMYLRNCIKKISPNYLIELYRRLRYK
ncbi:glycosyltransferase family 2 protein [Bacteroides sp.]